VARRQAGSNAATCSRNTRSTPVGSNRPDVSEIYLSAPKPLAVVAVAGPMGIGQHQLQ
jgi:hypothetical protein